MTITALVRNIQQKTKQNILKSTLILEKILDHCRTFSSSVLSYYSTCAKHTLADHPVTAGTSENEVFLETDKSDFTLFIHYWIDYHLYSVLNVVLPGSTMRCMCFAFWMNNTRVRFACEVRQHYTVCARYFKYIWSLFFKNKLSSMCYWL